MTLEIKDVRKVVVIGWDTAIVKGAQASIEAEGEEKRTVKNDGESNIFFPFDFEGEVTVTVSGSHSGAETAALDIS